MKTGEIIKLLQHGEQFGSESADWFTISRPKEHFFMLTIRDKDYFYRDITKYAKRIAKLIKTGC